MPGQILLFKEEGANLFMKDIKLPRSARTIELDPAKNYLILINFKKSGLSKEDIANIYFASMPIGSVEFALLQDDPDKTVQVIERVKE